MENPRVSNILWGWSKVISNAMAGDCSVNHRHMCLPRDIPLPETAHVPRGVKALQPLTPPCCKLIDQKSGLWVRYTNKVCMYDIHILLEVCSAQSTQRLPPPPKKKIPQTGGLYLWESNTYHVPAAHCLIVRPRSVVCVHHTQEKQALSGSPAAGC